MSTQIWKVPTLAEWLEEESNDRGWFFPGFVPRDSLVLMSGHKKRACKTWLADLLALLVATGKSSGLLVNQNMAPVLFCEEEGSHEGNRQRLLALCATYKIDPSSINNFYFAFRQRIKLDTELWCGRLIEKVRELDVKLVVFDALTYMHKADENKTNEMLNVVNTLHELRSLGATVLYLAHLDKTRGSDKLADIDDQVRGAGVITDAYDAHLALRRYRVKDPFIKLTLRLRDGGEEAHYRLAWEFGASTNNQFATSASCTIEIIEEEKT